MKTILQVLSGSRAYGTNDEWSDYDSTAIGMEALEERMHLGKKPLEDDALTNYDGRRYTLEKFVKLAAGGNPNIVEVLYSPVIEQDEIGEQLINIRPLFWSKRAGSAFLGYMSAQKERLMGIRGQKDVNRPDLVEKYGYDTKYAYHVIRLGIIGMEYLKFGHINLPMHPTNIDSLLAIRKGEITKEKVISHAEILEGMLKEEIATGDAPAQPELDKLSEWMRANYLKYWCHDYLLDKVPTNRYH